MAHPRILLASVLISTSLLGVPTVADGAETEACGVPELVSVVPLETHREVRLGGGYAYVNNWQGARSYSATGSEIHDFGLAYIFHAVTEAGDGVALVGDPLLFSIKWVELVSPDGLTTKVLSEISDASNAWVDGNRIAVLDFIDDGGTGSHELDLFDADGVHIATLPVVISYFGGDVQFGNERIYLNAGDHIAVYDRAGVLIGATPTDSQFGMRAGGGFLYARIPPGDLIVYTADGEFIRKVESEGVAPYLHTIGDSSIFYTADDPSSSTSALGYVAPLDGSSSTHIEEVEFPVGMTAYFDGFYYIGDVNTDSFVVADQSGNVVTRVAGWEDDDVAMLAAGRLVMFFESGRAEAFLPPFAAVGSLDLGAAGRTLGSVRGFTDESVLWVRVQYWDADVGYEFRVFDLGGCAGAPDHGTFRDDDGSAFESDIEWLAAAGITRGCNPPINDMFCPESSATRGQMAAFLHRALPDLAVGEARSFVDDDGSAFEGDIEWLADAGVTRGCNPPTNDMFCPDSPVTRGQMAAFLHRALPDLAVGEARSFVDDDGSMFEADIEWLAAAGITRGCNPPTNDRFCPDSPVTRAQMAAFLHRALGESAG